MKGRSLKIYDEKRQKKFQIEYLFLTIYSQLKLKLLAKFEFAKSQAKFENPAKLPEKIGVTTRRIKSPEKFSSAQINSEILNEDIRNINFSRKI